MRARTANASARLKVSARLLRQLGEQPAVARRGLAHREPPVNLPGLANRGVDDRNLKIPLEHGDDARGLPAAALDVDAVGAGMFEKQPLDVRVEHFRGNLRDLVEGNVDRFYRHKFQSGLGHVIEHDHMAQAGLKFVSMEPIDTNFNPAWAM